MSLKRVVTVVVALVCSAGLCLANATAAKADNLYASIRGTVTDASGGVLPDVNVTATNVATGVAQTVVSSKDGTYSFLQLAIGDYRVKAEKTGFKLFEETHIHLDVNQVYQLNPKMEIGAMAQEVVIEANAAQVETTTPQLGAVIDANQIVNMPLIGRDWVNLQALEPGVMAASDRFGLPGVAGPDLSTNGGQSQFNVFLIDGTETNDIALNTPTFIISPDAISEFRMVTSTLNPEYARSSGAVMNAVVKSGTNSFHGDGFEFYRDTFLDAANYFARPRVANPYQQNTFGGTLGGPAIKNHTFFFLSYQGVRATQPQTNPLGPTQTTPVYLNGQANGTTAFPGLSASTNVSPFPLVGDNGTTYPAGTPYSTIFSAGTVPTADINSVTSGLLKYVPSPNAASTVGGPLDEFSFNAVQPTRDNQYLIRVDQTFNAHDTIWGTWLTESLPITDTIPFVGATLPGFGMVSKQHYKFLTLDWTHIINDHMVNELRGGYNRFNFAAVYPENPTLPSSAGFSITPQITSGAGLPVMIVNGLFNLGFSEDGPQPRIDQVYEAVDNFSFTQGRHTLKLGFDMRRWEVFNPFSNTNDGAYTFSSIGTYSTGNPGVDFLLGIPAFYVQGSGALTDARAREYYSYAQDQYKLRPDLTITYGIGWTVDTPMINQGYNGHGQVSFVPNQQSVIFPNAPTGVVYEGDPGVHPAGAPNTWKYWGPRVGFAYSPNAGPEWLTGGPGKLSIRGGFGIYYNRSEQEQSNQTTGMPPFAITSTVGATSAGVIGVNPSFANPFADVATGAALPNPFPYPGPSSNVQFTQAAGYLPVFSFCCAVLSPTTQDPMAENYNLTVERQLSGDAVLTVGYVGSVAHHLTVGFPQNIATGLSATNAAIFRYNSGVYGPVDTIYSGGNSNYNALQVTLDKHLRHGLQFLASYTYSHSLDNASGFENSTFGEFGIEAGGFGTVRANNPYCFPKCDYASSIYDGRQRFVLSYFYQIPGMHGSSLFSRVTNGWTIGGITTFQTGFPLDVADVSDPSGGCLPLASDFSCWDGPNLAGAIHYLNPRATGQWFSASSFAPVICSTGDTTSCNGVNGPKMPVVPVAPNTAAAYGDAPRNLLRGPGLNNWDFQLFKDTMVTERTKVELRIEFYNVFNHTQFDPNGVVTDIVAPNFGAITEAHSPRQIQLAAKFYF